MSKLYIEIEMPSDEEVACLRMFTVGYAPISLKIARMPGFGNILECEFIERMISRSDCNSYVYRLTTLGTLVLAAYDAEAAGDGGQGVEDYTAWLVENHDDGNLRYLALDELLNIVWVEDADEAFHFARKEDGWRICEHGENHDLKVVDHQWPGGTPRKPVTIPADISWDQAKIDTLKDKVIEAARGFLHWWDTDAESDLWPSRIAEALNALDAATDKAGEGG